MLVKLSFVMQRLKKYLKKRFVMITKDGGGGIFRFYWGHTDVMTGDIELMGGPPTRENPDDCRYVRVGKTLMTVGMSSHLNNFFLIRSALCNTSIR